jgi:hypothetical protein
MRKTTKSPGEKVVKDIKRATRIALPDPDRRALVPAQAHAERSGLR